MKHKLTILTIATLLSACSQGQNDVLREYASAGNADADISLIIFDDKTFKMDVEILNANSKNDVILYVGNWSTGRGRT